jgi:hypothetical protein
VRLALGRVGVVRVRIGVPAHGLGESIDQIRAWLDTNCGADGSAMALAGLRGVLNDAIAIYFDDAALAGAFVARWCAGYKVRERRRRLPDTRGRPDPSPPPRAAEDTVKPY